MAYIRLLVLLLFLPSAGHAQSADPETLADIRQELEVVFVMVQKLKRELSTTGAPQVGGTAGGLQQRVDGIEAELQRLTAHTEELENRIERVVADGTMRISDLEFRLVELEGGDLAALEHTSTLGGDVSIKDDITDVSAPATVGPELALGEKEDFDRALEAYEAEDYSQAVNLFEAFNANYPSGPLSGAAHLYRGLALDGMGETGGAARAYLDAFSASPDGPEAPAALFQLGLSLNALGQSQQACVTLGEVGVRFPADPMVEKAENARTRLGCS